MTHCPAGISMLGLRPHHCLGLWYHPASTIVPSVSLQAHGTTTALLLVLQPILSYSRQLLQYGHCPPIITALLWRAKFATKITQFTYQNEPQ